MTSMWVNSLELYFLSGSTHEHNYAIVETDAPAACMERII